MIQLLVLYDAPINRAFDVLIETGVGKAPDGSGCTLGCGDPDQRDLTFEFKTTREARAAQKRVEQLHKGNRKFTYVIEKS